MLLTLRGICACKVFGFILRPGTTERVNTVNKENTVCYVQCDFFLITSDTSFLSICAWGSRLEVPPGPSGTSWLQGLDMWLFCRGSGAQWLRAQERIRELRVLLKSGVVGACLPRRKVERGEVQGFSKLQCEFRVSLGNVRYYSKANRDGQSGGREEDLCLLKVNLIYTASSRSAETLSQKTGSSPESVLVSQLGLEQG